MQAKAWIKILAGSDVAVVTIGVVAACIASSRDLTLFDYKKNKIDIQGVSHNVFYQNVLQVKANANFNVNDFVWTLPNDLQSVQFTISGEHNEILNIVNQNQTDQKIIFDIKVSNNIYNSPLYKINCFVDPSKCQQPVTSEEQNPNYTAADNAELLIKLTDYLEHHLPTFAIYNLQQICDNVYLTEEEKYHKIQEELLKQDVKLVDHVVLEEEIKEIEQSQDVKIQNLTGLDQHQKDQLVNDVHDLFDEYHHQAVDDVLLMSDLYDNTINFVETTDKIPQEQKIQIDADLLLEAFFENNTPVVSKTAAPFDEIIEKISNEFTTANTSLLGLVLTTKNGEPFDQNVVSNKFVLLSKITSSDITTFTINIQYTLGQINQDESLTIYEGEEPLECSYVLQPSLKLDQQQMSAWFNNLTFQPNPNVSWDYLVNRAGFEFNQYQSKIDVGSSYSYKCSFDSPYEYVDYKRYKHCVALYGWTITFDIKKYDNDIFGTHTIKWLNDNGYITNARIDLDARSSRNKQYYKSKLGWEEGSNISGGLFWHSERDLPMTGFAEWLGVYCGSSYNNAKMFRIANIAQNTTVSFTRSDNSIQSQLSTDWEIFANSIPHASDNTDHHDCAEWNVSNWYTVYDDWGSQWQTQNIPSIYNFEQENHYPNQRWNVEGKNEKGISEEIIKRGSLVPLVQIPDLLKFDNQDKNYVPTEHSDKYELLVGFDRHYGYDEMNMIGQVDFDLFVRNNTTKNCLQVKKYCVNFKKDLTPEMFAAQLATMLEIADLLSEDPQKIIIYMGVVIGYTIIEIGIEIALIVLQICDICTIASLIPIIFVGWILAAYYIYELATIVFSIITTIDLIIECKVKYENANKMYQNLIALREKHGDYISFLKNNLLLSTNPNFYISPNYINDYRDDDGLIDWYKTIIDELSKLSRAFGDRILSETVEDIINKSFESLAVNALAKRIKKITLAIFILSCASIFVSVIYLAVINGVFADYDRFEYNFSSEIRWNRIRTLLLNEEDELMNALQLWKEYIK